ncbi:hypothetical protein [Paenibacillus sp.]|uniref:hypothetical protein n=1 Tax=Paenibacillus sp. TaxID=58172 RepID=UPI0028A9AFC3|nr:hypothetical protein [Paenibacillus sp.]
MLQTIALYMIARHLSPERTVSLHRAPIKGVFISLIIPILTATRADDVRAVGSQIPQQNRHRLKRPGMFEEEC